MKGNPKEFEGTYTNTSTANGGQLGPLKNLAGTHKVETGMGKVETKVFVCYSIKHERILGIDCLKAINMETPQECNNTNDDIKKLIPETNLFFTENLLLPKRSNYDFEINIFQNRKKKSDLQECIQARKQE
jgi:hypothetical protein